MEADSLQERKESGETIVQHRVPQLYAGCALQYNTQRLSAPIVSLQCLH